MDGLIFGTIIIDKMNLHFHIKSVKFLYLALNQTLFKIVYISIGYPNGKYVCIGDQDGTVTMMELCESLYNLQPNEKEIMAEMFDRETKKEKALEQKRKAEELKKQAQQKEKEKKVVKIDFEAKKRQLIENTTKDFWDIIKADKKYYEEQLNLKLDQYSSKSQYQQEEGQQQEQQQPFQEELQHLQQETQQEQEQVEPKVQMQKEQQQIQQNEPQQLEEQQPEQQDVNVEQQAEQADDKPKVEEMQQKASEQEQLPEQQQDKQEEQQEQQA